MAIQKNNTTSIVTSENGAQVVLLGAAHVSRASAEEVREHLDGGEYAAGNNSPYRGAGTAFGGFCKMFLCNIIFIIIKE